jgi:hypothetical protein
MKTLIIFTLLISSNLFAHRGEFVSIENVIIHSKGDQVIFNFDLENIKAIELTDIVIALVVNDIHQVSIDIAKISKKQLFSSFQFSELDAGIDLEIDKIQIEIIKLFGRKKDWGGWDNPVATRQVNTLFSEFYADAPWRMKKTDSIGNIVGIPVHCFLHDADLDPIQDVNIDNINIQLKNASDASFGPVLTYDALNSVDFEALFSCLSPDDSDLDIREFSFASFTPTTSKTFDFDIDSDIFGDFLSVSEKYWYFTFTIPASDLVGMNDIIDILVTIEYTNLTFSDDKIGLRVFRTAEDMPSMNNYYRGDTHLHSMYTQSEAEIGLPMCATKEAAFLSGQDWITTTDHTSDFDNYGTSIQATDSSMLYITGLEVSLNNSDSKLVHMLAYPNPAQPFAMPYLSDGNGDLIGTSATIDNVLDSMATFNGFAYMAHPFATSDELPAIPVNGGIWNYGHADFPINASTFPIDGGVIICNDLTLPSDVLSSNSSELVKNGIKGGQIWNARYNLIATGDQLDPWDVQGGTTPFSQMDTTSQEFHFRRFSQGQEVVNHINQLGLQMKNNDLSATNWKLYYAAGTDAHGSFNNSNTDDFAGAGKITNNAVGKLSTVAYCPNGMGSNGENVLVALRDGNTTLSDGPILTIGISKDGPNSSNEVLMGEDAVLGSLSPASIHLNMNYTTTPEFGDITGIEIYLGTELGETKYPLAITSTTGSNSMSYQMDVLLDSILGIGNTPLNEYMYVRAELTSEVDYTGFEAEYRTTYDIFHSVSNPIWFRYEYNTSIEETNANNFYIYPNPVKALIHIAFEEKTDYRVEIRDQIGRIVITQVEREQIATINLSALASGVYYVDLLIEGKRQFIKFIRD